MKAFVGLQSEESKHGSDTEEERESLSDCSKKTDHSPIARGLSRPSATSYKERVHCRCGAGTPGASSKVDRVEGGRVERERASSRPE